LLYCRPGMEADCAGEALRQARQQSPVPVQPPPLQIDSGFVQITLQKHSLHYRELIFTRQLIRLYQVIEALPERDRLTPIVTAIAGTAGCFGTLWLEVPDTNEGKALSAFTRRFQPLLESALRERGILLAKETEAPRNLPRLHLFFPSKHSVFIGASNPDNSSPFVMGIVRQHMPAGAPSRSTLKLAEAIETFLDRGEQTRLLRPGMQAVDLGAAPGGWTWQLVKRGIRVTAVDNGPMKGELAGHPLVVHLRQDGFKYIPRRAVDWLVCDMIEKPSRVAELIGHWFVTGKCRHSIFNLKLPMKQRLDAVESALRGIRKRLDDEGINYKLMAKQLYHDRDEITVFITRTKG